MIFSFTWLREICPIAEDVEAAAALLTARGLTVDAVETQAHDETLEVDVPANRPDCLGHRGLARELSAACGVPMKALAPLPETQGDTAGSCISVGITDSAAARRYIAALVRGVKVAPSPDWIVRRLESCGLRSINNIVDISNLVMLETGQPVHFFDYDLLPGAAEGQVAIDVRRAREGETLRTLDGELRRLDESALLIAGGDRPLALAGVIGGAETEIRASTRNVLIEAAHFDAPTVRKMARALGIATDASFRFERGADALLGPEAAQRMAARLLADHAGGVLAPGSVDHFPARPAAGELLLRLETVQRLLGYRPTVAETKHALSAVGLEAAAEGESWRVTIPSWRADLGREADLVEEVARHLGYDRIPAARSGVADEQGLAGLSLEDRVREWLGHRGFHEAMVYSMISEGEDDLFVPEESAPPLSLVNPIAQPLAKMRRAILPGLLRAAESNQRRGTSDVRLFEVGRVFHAVDGQLLPREELRAAVVWSGAGEPRHWSRASRLVDLPDLIGLGQALIESHSQVACERGSGAFGAFHPGRSCRWMERDRLLAWGGSLHPELRSRFEADVFMLEIVLDALPAREGIRQRPIPRVPAVQRDLSLLIPAGATYAELVRIVGEATPPAPLTCEAIDRYRGAPLEPGQTSMTIRLRLQPRKTTLKDEQTDQFVRDVVARLEGELGIRIRS